MDVLRRVDRVLGVGLDPAGDAEITRFANKYKIGIGGLLDDNGIAYSKFEQFLLRVTMTADVLRGYLVQHPIRSSRNLRVVIGNSVGAAIQAYHLNNNPTFYAHDFLTVSDQQNAFYGALQHVTDFNNDVIRRIREFKNEAAALRRAIRPGAQSGAVYTNVSFQNF